MLSDYYSQYLENRNKLAGKLQFSDRTWPELPNPLNAQYMAYSQMLNEHSKELCNSINELGRLALALEAWDPVLRSKKEERTRLEIIVELINPIATTALNLPYVIRSRFIYSIAHLSHQANQSITKSWKDDLPCEEKIDFSTTDAYAKKWKPYKHLKACLEKISANDYRMRTANFRNKYHHRYSPRIEMGLTGLVTREVGECGQVTYGFGYTKPLKLYDIVPVLYKQQELCIDALEHHKKLIINQVESINEHNRALK